jgi:hypothetical protein
VRAVGRTGGKKSKEKRKEEIYIKHKINCIFTIINNNRITNECYCDKNVTLTNKNIKIKIQK